MSRFEQGFLSLSTRERKEREQQKETASKKTPVKAPEKRGIRMLAAHFARLLNESTALPCFSLPQREMSRLLKRLSVCVRVCVCGCRELELQSLSSAHFSSTTLSVEPFFTPEGMEMRRRLCVCMQIIYPL